MISASSVRDSAPQVRRVLTAEVSPSVICAGCNVTGVSVDIDTLYAKESGRARPLLRPRVVGAAQWCVGFRLDEDKGLRIDPLASALTAAYEVCIPSQSTGWMEVLI